MCFDAHRDLYASSRHAELALEGAVYRLRDVGSSNGTLVDGQPIAELLVRPSEPAIVEFGPGGPLVRLLIGAPGDAPVVPAVPPCRAPAPRIVGAGPGWLTVPVGCVAMVFALI